MKPEEEIKKLPGQEPRRHPETFAYRCFLSDLTRFTKSRRAGPTQAGSSITQEGGRCKEKDESRHLILGDDGPNYPLYERVR